MSVTIGLLGREGPPPKSLKATTASSANCGEQRATVNPRIDLAHCSAGATQQYRLAHHARLRLCGRRRAAQSLAEAVRRATGQNQVAGRARSSVQPQSSQQPRRVCPLAQTVGSHFKSFQEFGINASNRPKPTRRTVLIWLQVAQNSARRRPSQNFQEFGKRGIFKAKSIQG